jgi:hypothetical protein
MACHNPSLYFFNLLFLRHLAFLGLPASHSSRTIPGISVPDWSHCHLHSPTPALNHPCVPSNFPAS